MKPRTLAMLAMLLIFLIVRFFYAHIWLSEEQKALYTYFQTKSQTQSNSITLSEFSDFDWDEVCILKEYNDIYPGNLSRMPKALAHLDWKSYTGDIPDMRENLLFFRRAAWAFVFANKNQIVEIVPITSPIKIKGYTHFFDTTGKSNFCSTKEKSFLNIEGGNKIIRFQF